MNNKSDFDVFGQYLKEIGQYSTLSNEETKLLIEKAQSGDERSRDKVIKHNLKLIVTIAKSHTSSGVDILDLIEYGNIALINAIKNYDVNSDTKFCTYLTVCVDLYLRRMTSREVRVVYYSYHIYNIIGSIKKFCKYFFEVYGREATDEEIMKELKVRKDYVDLYRIIKDKNLLISAESMVIGCERSKIIDTIGDDDPNIDLVLDNINSKQMIEEIKNIKLPPKGAFILLYRYGFIDGKTHSLEEIGNMYNLTYERIRQIEAKSLRKLRWNRKFKEYLKN